MSKVENAHEELLVEWNQFQSAWRDSRAVWKDGVALQFEKRFISPMESEIPAFLNALETLRDALQAAHQELR